MSTCPAFSAQGPVSVADALKSVDCLSGQAVEIAFSRLFGTSGALSQALTLILSLYVALLAINLLTGRTQLRLNMLTPRMLQLGLVLTFATSWAAYQSVAWNLLIGAPDEVASQLLGTQGSATVLFAQRLDTLFDVIADSAHLASGANAIAPTPGVPVPQIAGASPKPADLLWAASLLLLLGTVGVLIVARIALATIMALGPVFILLALFKGTRGLFEGWLKAAVMLAITPLLAVLIGGGTLVMITPMIRALQNAGSKVTLELATSVFLAAFVYVALMVLALRAAKMITSGWRMFGGADVEPVADTPAAALTPASTAIPMLNAPLANEGGGTDRVRAMVSGMTANGVAADTLANDNIVSDRRTIIAATRQASTDDTGSGAANSVPDPRIRPLGQGFRAPNRILAEVK